MKSISEFLNQLRRMFHQRGQAGYDQAKTSGDNLRMNNFIKNISTSKDSSFAQAATMKLLKSVSFKSIASRLLVAQQSLSGAQNSTPKQHSVMANAWRRQATALVLFLALLYTPVIQAQTQDITPVVGSNVITNGSFYGTDYNPALNSTHFNNWSAAQNALGFWVGVTFSNPSAINTISIQGRYSHINGAQYVTSYRVDGTKDGSTWEDLGTYSGNVNTFTIVTSNISNTDTDWTGVRIFPLEYIGWPSLRFGVNITPYSTPTPDPLSIVKSEPVNADGDGDGRLSVGDELTYTVTATAGGGGAATNVALSPSGTADQISTWSGYEDLDASRAIDGITTGTTAFGGMSRTGGYTAYDWWIDGQDLT